MIKELTNELKQTFPELFKNAQEPFTKSGFECADGWYDLLEDLCTKLEEIAQEDHLELVVAQVKEKFGELRFYTFGGNSRTDDAINEASGKSLTVCEICGDDGKLESIRHYLKTVCADCLADRLA